MLCYRLKATGLNSAFSCNTCKINQGNSGKAGSHVCVTVAMFDCASLVYVISCSCVNRHHLTSRCFRTTNKFKCKAFCPSLEILSLKVPSLDCVTLSEAVKVRPVFVLCMLHLLNYRCLISRCLFCLLSLVLFTSLCWFVDTSFIVVLALISFVVCVRWL